ncbi:MAG: DUF4238 domain-containing protein, partial [Solirubrobacteraceae bacterium]
MSSASPKRHHLVSQFYLAAWADDQGMVTACRRTGPEFRASPNNVGHRRDFYSVAGKDGETYRQIETDFLAPIEDAAAPVLRRVLGGEFPLPPD